jgi:hypothetical protein
LAVNYTNVKITEYKDFLKALEDVGFMPLSNNCINFINLSDLTPPEQWHTDLPSDPWQWRIKAEEEHKAAYGKLFDKKPGFISLEWYPVFLSARRKGETFDEIYSGGLISRYAKQIYELFEEHETLATHEIKSLCGFTKELNSKYESAMSELQMGMFITINGEKRKMNSDGEEYGWPSTAYSTVEKWAGEELMDEAWSIKPGDASDMILERIMDFNPNAEHRKIRKFAGF